MICLDSLGKKIQIFTEVLFGVPDKSRTSWGVQEWPWNEDWYIGSPSLDTGKVVVVVVDIIVIVVVIGVVVVVVVCRNIIKGILCISSDTLWRFYKWISNTS